PDGPAGGEGAGQSCVPLAVVGLVAPGPGAAERPPHPLVPPGQRPRRGPAPQARASTLRPCPERDTRPDDRPHGEAAWPGRRVRNRRCRPALLAPAVRRAPRRPGAAGPIAALTRAFGRSPRLTAML